MSPEHSAVEVSRWTREAEAAVALRISLEQSGEAFAAPSWIRFACEESVRLVAVAFFVAVVLGWAAIFAV